MLVGVTIDNTTIELGLAIYLYIRHYAFYAFDKVTFQNTPMLLYTCTRVVDEHGSFFQF